MVLKGCVLVPGPSRRHSWPARRRSRSCVNVQRLLPHRKLGAVGQGSIGRWSNGGPKKSDEDGRDEVQTGSPDEHLVGFLPTGAERPYGPLAVRVYCTLSRKGNPSSLKILGDRTTLPSCLRGTPRQFYFVCVSNSIFIMHIHGHFCECFWSWQHVRPVLSSLGRGSQTSRPEGQFRTVAKQRSSPTGGVSRRLDPAGSASPGQACKGYHGQGRHGSVATGKSLNPLIETGTG